MIDYDKKFHVFEILIQKMWNLLVNNDQKNIDV